MSASSTTSSGSSSSFNLTLTISLASLLSVIIMPISSAQAIDQRTTETKASSMNNIAITTSPMMKINVANQFKSKSSNPYEAKNTNDSSSEIRTIYVDSTPLNEAEELPMMNQLAAQRLRRELLGTTNTGGDLWPRNAKVNDLAKVTTATTTATTTAMAATTATTQAPALAVPPRPSPDHSKSSLAPGGVGGEPKMKMNSSENNGTHSKFDKMRHSGSHRLYAKKVRENRKLLAEKATAFALMNHRGNSNLTAAASYTHEDWVNYDDPDEHMTSEQASATSKAGAGLTSGSIHAAKGESAKQQSHSTGSRQSGGADEKPQTTNKSKPAEDLATTTESAEHVVVRKESSSDEDEHPLVSKSSTTTTTIGDGKKKAKVVSKSAALPPGLRQRIIEQFVKSGGNPQNIVVSDSTITTTSQSKKKTITTVYKVVPNTRKLVPAKKMSLGPKGPSFPAMKGSLKGGQHDGAPFNMGGGGGKFMLPPSQMSFNMPPASIPRAKLELQNVGGQVLSGPRKFKKIMVTRTEVPKEGVSFNTKGGQQISMSDNESNKNSNNNKGNDGNTRGNNNYKTLTDNELDDLMQMIPHDMIFEQPEEFNFPKKKKTMNTNSMDKGVAPMTLQVPVMQIQGQQQPPSTSKQPPKQPMFKVQLMEGGGVDDDDGDGDAEDDSNSSEQQPELVSAKKMKGVGGAGISLNALMDALKKMNMSGQKGRSAKFAFISHQEERMPREMVTKSLGQNEGSFNDMVDKMVSGKQHLTNFNQHQSGAGAGAGSPKQPMSRKPSDNNGAIADEDNVRDEEDETSGSHSSGPKREEDDDDSGAEVFTSTEFNVGQKDQHSEAGPNGGITIQSRPDKVSTGQGDLKVRGPEESSSGQARSKPTNQLEPQSGLQGHNEGDEKLNTLIGGELKRVISSMGGNERQVKVMTAPLPAKKWNTPGSGTKWHDPSGPNKSLNDAQETGKAEKLAKATNSVAKNKLKTSAKLPVPVSQTANTTTTTHSESNNKLDKESSSREQKTDLSTVRGRSKTHNIMMLIDFSPQLSTPEASSLRAQQSSQQQAATSQQQQQQQQQQAMEAKQQSSSTPNQAQRLPATRASNLRQQSSLPAASAAAASPSIDTRESYGWPLEPPLDHRQWRPLEGDKIGRVSLAPSQVQQANQMQLAEFEDELGHEGPVPQAEAQLAPADEMTSADYGDSMDQEDRSSRQRLLHLAPGQPTSMETMLFNSAAASHQHHLKTPKPPNFTHHYHLNHHQAHSHELPFMVAQAQHEAATNPFVFSSESAPEIHANLYEPPEHQPEELDDQQHQQQHHHQQHRRHLSHSTRAPILPEESAKTNQLVNQVIDELAMSHPADHLARPAATRTSTTTTTSGASNATGRLFATTSVHDSTSSITEDEELTEMSSHNLEHNFDLRRRDRAA